MSKVSVISVFAFSLLIVLSSAAPVAVVRLFGTSNSPQTNGLIRFESTSVGNVFDVFFNISGLGANSSHGVHVHSWGDISSADGLAAGPHYNPFNVSHGCFPDNQTRHIGDLGNVRADESGRVLTTLRNVTLLDFLNASSSSCIGRGFILHELADDCVSQSVGNSGQRFAQGVIGSALGTDASIGGTTSFLAENSSILVARIDPTLGNGMHGLVFFRVSPINSSRIQVFINLTNVLPRNVLLGFFLNEDGDWSNLDGSSVGGLFNPLNVSVSSDSLLDLEGILPNICADSFGKLTGVMEVETSMLASFVGRSVAVYAPIDSSDIIFHPGMNGTCLGVGVIGITSQSFPTLNETIHSITTCAPIVPAFNATSSSSSGMGNSTSSSSSGMGNSTSSSSGGIVIVNLTSSSSGMNFTSSSGGIVIVNLTSSSGMDNSTSSSGGIVNVTSSSGSLFHPSTSGGIVIIPSSSHSGRSTGSSGGSGSSGSSGTMGENGAFSVHSAFSLFVLVASATTVAVLQSLL